MKRTFVMLVAGLLLFSGLDARGMQNDDRKDYSKKANCMSEEPYYQYMVFRMTEILELTAEQAEKLFPLNRPYRNEKHALHMQMGALSEEVFQKETVTKADLEKYKNDIYRLHEQEMALDKEFIEAAEKFLEPEQVAKLIFFEPRFRKELSYELKERYESRPEEKKGKKKFWEKRK